MRKHLYRGFHECANGNTVITIDGKQIIGTWAEGNLFVGDDGECEILIGTQVVRISYPVIPETVCEYTSLTDKNGKKIFEGDIVKNSRDVGLLYYKEKNSAFTVKGWEYGYWLWHDKEDIEVIGNIYDNKDLLKED